MDSKDGGELLFVYRDLLGQINHYAESSKYFSGVWYDIVCGF